MRSAILSNTMLSAGDTDLTGYSFAGELARRNREVVGCGDRMVGAGDSSEVGEPSSMTVVGTGWTGATRGSRARLVFGPVRMLEGRICSKPWLRATFSMDLKYCVIHGRGSVPEREPLAFVGRA